MNIERAVNEFCQEGNLEDYRNLLLHLFTEIKNSGCLISTKYNDGYSLHEKSPTSCRIRISFARKYPTPTHIIWIILHEFGHHFEPLDIEDKDNIEIRVQHEEKAWEWAYNKILTIDELKNKIDEFIECKEYYMKDYYKHLEKYRQLNENK